MEPGSNTVPHLPSDVFLSTPRILEPLSAPLTPTPISSTSQSRGKSSSLADSNSIFDVNLGDEVVEHVLPDSETTSHAIDKAQSGLPLPNEAGVTMKQLLMPQKALPSKVTLVSDASPALLSVPDGQSGPRSTNVRPGQQRRWTEGGGSPTEQEIRVRDFNLNVEWPQEEHDELIHCLKEEGLLRCLYEYLNVREYSAAKLLRAFGKEVPDDTTFTSEELLVKLQSAMRQALRNRSRIENYTTVGDAVKLLWRAQKIMVLTGAGISVACGVPDFRSSDGIYARIKASGQYDDLEDPQEMFSLNQFIRRPSMFYSFIGQLWPKDVQPSISHEFIRLLETKNKLLRNYTQNIDSMESVAGVERVFHCHGSFATAKCMDCQNEVPGSAIRDDVLKGEVPRCAPCVKLAEEAAALRPKEKDKPKKKQKKRPSGWDSEESDNEPHRDIPLAGVMKPGITFFGEKLSDSFENLLYADRDEVDLLLIIGTSLKVKSISEILAAYIPHSIPQILINKTPVEHANPDIVLLGDCDKIIEYLCHELEWVIPSKVEERGQSRRKRKSEELANNDINPKRLGNSHIWLFENSQISMSFARRHDPTFTRERKSKRPKLN